MISAKTLFPNKSHLQLWGLRLGGIFWMNTIQHTATIHYIGSFSFWIIDFSSIIWTPMAFSVINIKMTHSFKKCLTYKQFIFILSSSYWITWIINSIFYFLFLTVSFKFLFLHDPCRVYYVYYVKWPVCIYRIWYRESIDFVLILS